MIINGSLPETFEGFEGFGGTHVNSRHPRTAVGFNEDSTKLFLLVVDGRQPNLSVGMNLPEMAEYMRSIGCYNAINLDGGGSSVMVVRNEIVSSPSDPQGERSVANALLVVSTAPLGPLNKLHITPDSIRIFMGKTLQFSIQGTDEYLNPVGLNPANLVYELSKPALGEITQSGLFTAGTVDDSGYIRVSYESVTDSVFVRVKTIDRVEVKPGFAVTNLSRLINFSAHIFDSDNEEQEISAAAVQWMSTDTTVGTVDQVGQFKGKKAGSCFVVASYLSKYDSAAVHIEIGSGTSILDSMETMDNWNLTGQNIDTSATILSISSEHSSLGEASFQIDYEFTYATSQFNWVYLNTNLPIFGIPDSIAVDVLSNGFTHRVFFDLEDSEGIIYRVAANGLAIQPVFTNLRGRIPTTGSVVFPLTLKRIAMPLGSGQVNEQVYSGTIYVDNLKLVYPEVTTSITEENLSSKDFNLFQNYPNPFNPSTKIKFSHSGSSESSIVLKIYDILGNEVVELFNEKKPAGLYEIEFDASTLSSGMYFYRLSSGGFMTTKKMMLLK
jgi:hypothetical protein